MVRQRCWQRLSRRCGKFHWFHWNLAEMARNESEILRGRIISRDDPDREDANSGPSRSKSSLAWLRKWGNPTAPSPLCRNCSRSQDRGRCLKTCRVLPRCSGSIQCSIRSERSAFTKTRGRGSAEINSLHERMLAYAVWRRGMRD